MQILNKINGFVWGLPTLLLIFLTGIILTLRTDFFAVKNFKRAIKLFFTGKKQTENTNRLTPLQSASTALSATMGTGNIVGVAGAVALGGPGAVFWMWVSAFFCMSVKFAEIVLAVRYREQNSDGSYLGGAMYYIKNALPSSFAPLAKIFCVFGVTAALGMGNMTQINTVSASVCTLFKTLGVVSPSAVFFIKLATGTICAAVCFFVLKNDGSVGRFCEKIFPVMTVLYITLTVGVIAVNRSEIPTAFKNIFICAFKPYSVTGGAVGSAFVAVRFGVSRGVFSNEAGLGTAPIAYACSDGDEISLGLMGVIEVFTDTVVVCTLTALALLCAGDITYGVDSASALTLNMLNKVYGKYVIFIFCPIICFFAFSSAVGWGLYGQKFTVFLFGENSKNVFLALFIALIIPSALFRADAVWVIAEILNGLMALPNITALLFLSGEVNNTARCRKKLKKQTI